MNKISLTIILLITILASFAQSRFSILGKVIDSKTKEILPFTNIYLKNNGAGTISDIDGVFIIKANSIDDTVVFSAIGYDTKLLPISSLDNDFTVIGLDSHDFELDEIVIIPGENPAMRIMRNVIAAKEKNNPMNAPSFICNAYTKIMVEALNFKEGQSSTPMFFSEKLSQNIVQQNPFIEKGKIVSENQEGLGFLRDLSIVGYSNNLSINYNFYENIINIFEKPFISPLNNRGFIFYKYTLKDSLTTKIGKEYLIEVKPKNSRDLTFLGHIKVIDESWALSEVSFSVPNSANLNYVNKLNVYQKFKLVNDSLMFFSINDTKAELKITKDKSLINIDITAKVDKRTVYDSVMVLPVAVKVGNEDSVWNMINPVEGSKTSAIEDFRPEALSSYETRNIEVIDSLNNNWKIKSADAISQMFITGYIPGKIIDLGPYLELAKFNKVEGTRFTFTGRTSSNITKNTMLYGHVGYGLGDNEWKYGLGIEHKLKSKNRSILKLEYRNDLTSIGDNRSIFLIKENMMVTGEDNIISSIFTSSPLDKLSREKRLLAQYEHEWKPGLTTNVGLTGREISSGKYIPFLRNGNPVSDVSTLEASVGLRLSWHENYSDNYCRRYYLETKYPVVNIKLTGGRYQFDDITDEYLTLRTVVKHKVNMWQTTLDYVVEAGGTLGTVPFPLLDFCRSNQSLGYAIFSFNMMDEMEFASDRFISLMAQYHVNGLVINRIPLLKNLGIREIVSAKVLWSHLSDEHSTMLDYPFSLQDARTPYTELSVGFENIFQYFRVDAVWRLSRFNNAQAKLFGIRARFEVSL